MTKFVCSKCNYRFEANQADSCPYCGGKTIEREKSASELLNEVTNMLKESKRT
jgi:DNA-directed RNA polymerase subunit RPC12/RpoP